MALFVSAQLCVIEDISVMAIACFLVFSSCPPCLTQELPRRFWHQVFMASLPYKSIFPNSSLASALPSWNHISESFCDVSFALSLWDSACHKNTSPRTWFWLPPPLQALWCSPLLPAASCVLVSFKGYLKPPFPAVSGSLGVLLLIIIVLKRLTVLPVQDWPELDEDVVQLWVTLGLSAQWESTTKHSFDVHKPCGTKH